MYFSHDGIFRNCSHPHKCKANTENVFKVIRNGFRADNDAKTKMTEMESTRSELECREMIKLYFTGNACGMFKLLTFLNHSSHSTVRTTKTILEK